ncbi:hypothetical protein K505DRAFT_323456 [Melanomma pulvis-pyrius CBS 109.77]|uniref:Uncharacterized protein n=1 Tax=Melanomma pulvis-pyrius CBS 109.77 TaxID=1314802 RepID=A0A6A6XIE8_9PLEO|nr:hypothetical protein K505DRAFT_323456 [Melanomma pulvis-pyrius CBS 109.77]
MALLSSLSSSQLSSQASPSHLGRPKQATQSSRDMGLRLRLSPHSKREQSDTSPFLSPTSTSPIPALHTSTSLPLHAATLRTYRTSCREPPRGNPLGKHEPPIHRL